MFSSLSQSLFSFQSPSVIPLLGAISAFTLLLLAGIFLLERLLPLSRISQWINLALFPIVTALLVIAALFIDRLGMLKAATLNGLLGGLAVWPTLVVIAILGLLNWKFNPLSYLSYHLYLRAHQIGGESIMHRLQTSVLTPLFDDLIFRYFAINSLVLAGLGVVEAIVWSSVIFGALHLADMRERKWVGCSETNRMLIFGFTQGVVAASFGIIIAIGYSIASSVLHAIFAKPTVKS